MQDAGEADQASAASTEDRVPSSSMWLYAVLEGLSWIVRARMHNIYVRV
jgi:hypothetical protein